MKAFKSMSLHIREGGCICLPINFPKNKSFTTMPERFDYKIKASKTHDIIKVYKIGITEYDSLSMTTRISQEVFIESKNHKDSFHHEFILKDYTYDEIDFLLSNNNLEIINRYSDYKMNKWNGESFCIIEAVK